jgi:hypothetical protein
MTDPADLKVWTSEVLLGIAERIKVKMGSIGEPTTSASKRRASLREPGSAQVLQRMISGRSLLGTLDGPLGDGHVWAFL